MYHIKNLANSYFIISTTYLVYKRYDLNNILQNKWTLINEQSIVSKSNTGYENCVYYV